MIPVENIKTKYGSEIALVVLCCRLHFGTEDRSSLQKFIANNTVNWEYVKYLSRYHRIAPIVYKTLAAASLPTETALQIKQKHLYLIQQSFKRALETEWIINLLQENSISCAPYKGIAFSRQFYGDIVSRESSDIDLIIIPDRFDKVIELMEANGYRFENRVEYNYYNEAIFSRRKDLNFNKYKNNTREFHVEFHWRITNNALLIKKETNTLLFQNNEDILLAKNKVKGLNANAHYMAILIHHSTSDGFSVLRNIIDIGQAVSDQSSLDTAYIKKCLNDFNLTKAGEICNFLCKELLGIILPFTIDNKKNISAKVKKYFIEQLLQKKRIGDYLKVTLYRKSIFYLKSSARDKISYLIASFRLRFKPSVKDLRIFKFPKTLHFLYFIIKPLRSLISPASAIEEKEIVRNQK
ncbi:MAG TPA: nucleotidyltransferase family protein [Niabella sp.]|nr:nucleotidyltransferase family protein [Niabella sp.]